MENQDQSGTPPATAAAPIKPTDPVPSKGRVVMFRAHINDEIVEHTALVVHVWGDGPDACVNLAVFDSNGKTYSRTSVSKGESDQPETWGWPRRVS